MSQINTNVSSLLAQRILGDQNQSLTKALERLSTGMRINRGADDPAGLIASEKLRSEQAGISAAIGNAERADQVVNIAEGGLQEISALLLEVQSLVGRSANEAGLSTEEKEANQLQIDSILQTIDRLAQATSFEGIKLLNGTFDFTISGQSTSVADYAINAAKLEIGETRAISVVVTASAQHGGLFLSAQGASQLDLTAASSTFVLEIAGALGSREFSFASGTNLSAVTAGINTFKSVVGVSATVSGTGIVLKSLEYGSNEFVSVNVVDDGGQAGSLYRLTATDENSADTGTGTAFSAATNAIRDDGQNVGVIINGISATSQGRTARVNTDFLDVSLEFTETGATTLGGLTAFHITGGGAKFNIGPSVNITNQVSLGIENVASRHLGRVVDDGVTYNLDDLGAGKGLNVVDGNIEVAQKAVDGAIGQVANLRGRLGAFQQNIVGATIRSLGVALENTSAAESAIRDTDFAAETAELTRSQILVNAATNVLAIANSQPQSVLALLG